MAAAAAAATAVTAPTTATAENEAEEAMVRDEGTEMVARDQATLPRPPLTPPPDSPQWEESGGATKNRDSRE